MNEVTEKREMLQDYYDRLTDLVQRLAYPAKYAPDYNEWFSGDGPAEVYFCQLSENAKKILEEYGNE